MNSPIISFDNWPRSYLKCRSDFPSNIRGENDKVASLNIDNLGDQQCKLRIRLLLKDNDDINHFYHLVTLPDKVQKAEIECGISNNMSHVKLDFVGIKKAMKKEAMVYLKGIFNQEAESIYKKNSSTVVLQISLLNTVNNKPYNILKFEFCDQKDKISVKYFSPHTILYDDDNMELIFLLENPEKDNESIFLEINVGSVKKTVPSKDLSKATSIKNVFVFSLKQMGLRLGEFEARLSRKSRNKDGSAVHSDWVTFEIIDSGIENGKRKVNIDHESAPHRKIPRSVSTSISESSMSDIHIEEYVSSSSSSFSFIRTLNKQDLKSILETRVLSSIARVGHDFAFGAPITDATVNVTNKLPIVYTLQDDVGDTPLHNAILKNHEKRAIFILNIVSNHFHQELFTRNTSNHTALILSPACGMSVEFVRRLLDLGFNVSDKDLDGNNALSIAIEYKNTTILDTLVQDAITKKVFNDDISEVKDLLLKTLKANYFEGFKILMESYMYYDLNLDGDYEDIYQDYLNQLNYTVAPLPELNINDMDLDFLDDDYPLTP